MRAEALVTYAHVAAGTLVLVLAPVAMVVGKGGRQHRRAGFAFVAGMSIVVATAALMWAPHGHLFLLFLDVVSAYLVFEGVRVLRRRRFASHHAGARALDLAAALSVLVSAAALVAIALFASTPLIRELGLVLVALAAIAGTFAALDLRALIARKQTRLGSLLMHLSAMIGAYISAVTAFCVINVHAAPMMLRWFVPSAAGTLVIAGFSIAYRRRFALANARAETVRKLAPEIAGNQ